jgi:universal stress protein E
MGKGAFAREIAQSPAACDAMESAMNPIESILVVLDRSRRDQQVCDKAVWLSRLLDARLELFLCDAEHALALKHNYDRRAVEQSRNACVAEAVRYLGSVRERMPLDPGHVRTSAWCDSPLSEGICRKVAEAKPDLVLKSPDCDHPGQCLSFSDNDWHLASTCPVPIMFVRGKAWGTVPRLGAAVDVSSPQGLPLVREIAGVASQLHSHAHGHLELVCCVPPGSPEAPIELHSGRLDETLSHLPVVRQNVHMLDGDSDELIPRFAAERGYDVLIMGALARRTGVAPMVGSLTGKLITALDCDIVLVKAPNE